MLLWLFTPCNGLYIRHFRNKGTGAEMRPGIVSGIVTGNAPTYHADVLRGSSRVPAPLHA